MIDRNEEESINADVDFLQQIRQHAKDGRTESIQGMCTDWINELTDNEFGQKDE